LFCDSASGFHLCGADYGWRVLGTLEVGEAEISPKQLTALMEALKSEENCLLLLNPYEPSKTAEVLSEQLGLPSVDFDILEVATRSYSSIMAEILMVSSMLLGSECHV